MSTPRRWRSPRSRRCAPARSRSCRRAGKRRSSTGWRISSPGASRGNCGGGTGFRRGRVQNTNGMVVTSSVKAPMVSMSPKQKLRRFSSLKPMPEHAELSFLILGRRPSKRGKQANPAYLMKIAYVWCATQTSSTHGSAQPSGPLRHWAGRRNNYLPGTGRGTMRSMVEGASRHLVTLPQPEPTPPPPSAVPLPVPGRFRASLPAITPMTC